MFAEINIYMNKRKLAACSAFMAIPLHTRNFFCASIIKIRRNIDHHYKIYMLMQDILSKFKNQYSTSAASTSYSNLCVLHMHMKFVSQKS
jgi:hypothetical protein